MNILSYNSQLKIQWNCDESIFNLNKGPFSAHMFFPGKLPVSSLGVSYVNT